MHEPTASIVRSLAARGWTLADFQANHMEHLALEVLGESPQPLRAPFVNYWRTVAKISSLLQNEGISHVIIKTRRSYPYSDTNVDVFVTDRDVSAVQEALCEASWRIPSRPVIWKQRLIEREKLKLPSVDADLVPAHLYMSVSWRYQREVTFLDEGMIEEMPLKEEAAVLEGEFPALTIPVPTRAADILLHSAEIVFENYRLTLGEALYMSWLMEHVSAEQQREVSRLGVDRGAEVAMRCIRSRARSAVVHDPEDLETDWPRNLTWRELWTSWGERFGMQVRRGSVLPAFEELFGYAAFGSMYRIKRAWFE